MCSEPLRPRPSDRLAQAPVQVIYLDTISTHMYVPWSVGMDTTTYVCTASSQVSTGLRCQVCTWHCLPYILVQYAGHLSSGLNTLPVCMYKNARFFFQTAESGGIEATIMPLD